MALLGERHGWQRIIKKASKLSTCQRHRLGLTTNYSAGAGSADGSGVSKDKLTTPE